MRHGLDEQLAHLGAEDSLVGGVAWHDLRMAFGEQGQCSPQARPDLLVGRGRRVQAPRMPHEACGKRRPAQEMVPIEAEHAMSKERPQVVAITEAAVETDPGRPCGNGSTVAAIVISTSQDWCHSAPRPSAK